LLELHLIPFGKRIDHARLEGLQKIIGLNKECLFFAETFYMRVKGYIGLIFSSVSILELCVGLFWGYNSFVFYRSVTSVSGKVVENIQETCSGKNGSYTCFRPVIEIEYLKKKYKKILSERSSDQYQIGEIREILIDSRNPESKKASSFIDLFLFPILLTVTALIVGIPGVLLFRSYYLRKKLEDYLLVSGAPIRASVIEVGINRSISRNGMNPFMIRAQFNAPITNIPVVVVEDEIWHDPTSSGDIAKDNTVEVLYDRNDPKRCMIVLGKSKNAKAA
jgi:hypothetical protein